MGVVIEAPFAHRSELGEGPHWDGNRLLYVDMLCGEVHRLDPGTGERGTLRLDGRVGFAVPHEAGGLVVGRDASLEVVDDDGRPVRTLATVGTDEPRTAINDGKCDARGRVFCGTFAGDDVNRTTAGGLFRTGADGTEQVFGEVSLSNGLGWDEARGRFYYVDTWTHRIDVCDYDVATGSVADRRPFARVDGDDGLIDGLTVDVEGGVWVALFGGGALRRYAPDGTLSLELALPVALPTSVAFGGPDLRTLFVTSAWWGMGEAERDAQPLAGAVLVVDPGIAGVPATAAAVDL